jgi:hypothetical protein
MLAYNQIRGEPIGKLQNSFVCGSKSRQISVVRVVYLAYAEG